MRRNLALTLTSIAVLIAQQAFLSDWFTSTMPRHQAFHIPLLVIMGIVIGSQNRQIKTQHSLSILIFVMASFTLYMLPYMVDLSAISLKISILRQLHLVFCGWLIAIALPHAIFEVRIAFLGMLTSTTAAAALAMRQFNVLLCSAFTIPQQQRTGTYFLYISGALLLLTLYHLFRGLSGKNT